MIDKERSDRNGPVTIAGTKKYTKYEAIFIWSKFLNKIDYPLDASNLMKIMYF